MKFSDVLVCAGLALLATTEAGVVPLKAGLSPKDKLALDIPVKQHLTDKTGEKGKASKVAFSTTTTTTTTTTTAAPKPQRPKYVDAAVFRYQFTTPSASTTSAVSVNDGESASSSIPFSRSEIQPQDGSEVGLVTDRKSESFRRDFRPASSGSTVIQFPSTSSSTSTGASTTSTTTVSTPPAYQEEAESIDYEAHFRLLDDLSPFGGELGILGGDRRGAGYIGSFRPLGF